jgi:hypothetical protein
MDALTGAEDGPPSRCSVQRRAPPRVPRLRLETESPQERRSQRFPRATTCGASNSDWRLVVSVSLQFRPSSSGQFSDRRVSQRGGESRRACSILLRHTGKSSTISRSTCAPRSPSSRFSPTSSTMYRPGCFESPRKCSAFSTSARKSSSSARLPSFGVNGGIASTRDGWLVPF